MFPLHKGAVCAATEFTSVVAFGEAFLQGWIDVPLPIWALHVELFIFY